MIFKIAFRNVLRNKKRSFLTTLSIFIAAIIVGVAQSWVNGMTGIYLENFVRYQTGHVRITTKRFIKRQKFMPVDEIIKNSDKLINKIKKINGVKSVNERIRFGILLARKNTTLVAFGMGINLENNKFKLKQKIIKGNLAEGGIYIGEKLAEKLGVSIGEPLLLAVNSSQFGLNAIKLPVKGIFRFNMMYDKNLFFISLKSAKRLLKIYNGTTEIYVYAKDIDIASQVEKNIKKILPSGLAAQDFKTQLGSFYDTIASAQQIYAVIEALIMFLASFVIINTMMMAIFERLREIGTLKALGMTNRQLFFNFTLEGAILGTAGGVLGAIIGTLIIVILSHVGIDFSSQMKDMKMPIEYILRPEVKIKDLLIAVGLSISVPALAAMLPARYVRKLMPAEALRK